MANRNNEPSSSRRPRAESSVSDTTEVDPSYENNAAQNMAQRNENNSNAQFATANNNLPALRADNGSTSRPGPSTSSGRIPLPQFRGDRVPHPPRMGFFPPVVPPPAAATTSPSPPRPAVSEHTRMLLDNLTNNLREQRRRNYGPTVTTPPPPSPFAPATAAPTTVRDLYLTPDEPGYALVKEMEDVLALAASTFGTAPPTAGSSPPHGRVVYLVVHDRGADHPEKTVMRNLADANKMVLDIFVKYYLRPALAMGRELVRWRDRFPWRLREGVLLWDVDMDHGGGLSVVWSEARRVVRLEVSRVVEQRGYALGSC